MGKKINKGKKYYAVVRGYIPGIYETWKECEAQTKNFKGNRYKSFNTYEEALQFMKDGEEEKEIQKNEKENEKSNQNEKTNGNEKTNENENGASEVIERNPTYAYIDGSFNVKTKYYGYGGFIMHNGKKYIIQGKGNKPELLVMRNIGGEITASMEVAKTAIGLGIKKIDIFYDYSGIEEWAKGSWNRKKDGTKDYYNFMQSISDKIDINFIKVRSHSGIEGNEEADKLAKEAVDIFEDEEDNTNEEDKAKFKSPRYRRFRYFIKKIYEKKRSKLNN